MSLSLKFAAFVPAAFCSKAPLPLANHRVQGTPKTTRQKQPNKVRHFHLSLATTVGRRHLEDPQSGATSKTDTYGDSKLFLQWVIERGGSGREQKGERRENAKEAQHDRDKTNSTSRQQKTLNKRPRFHCSSILMVADNKQLPSRGPAHPAAAVSQARGEGADSPASSGSPAALFPASRSCTAATDPAFGKQSGRGSFAGVFSSLLRPPGTARSRLGRKQLESPAPGGPRGGEWAPHLWPKGHPSPTPPALGVITTRERSLGNPRLVSLSPLHPPCLSRSRPRALSGTAEG